MKLAREARIHARSWAAFMVRNMESAASRDKQRGKFRSSPPRLTYSELLRFDTTFDRRLKLNEAKRKSKRKRYVP